MIYPKALTTIIILAFLFAALILATTLGDKTKDVTADPNFGDFKSVVGTWKTKIPLRLVEIQKELHLVYGDQAIGNSRELPELPIGTEIRIEHLTFQHTFEVDLLDVVGSVVNGPYANKPVYIDGRLFMQVDEPQFHAKDWVNSYYSTWNHPDDPKPKWVVAPDKLERLPLEQGSQK
ncbi:MAG TPA: hypothetical protein VHG71_10775 [Verrucomicrobiae bacterium]|nr:hypothetical protein [Verrucomicrobiae bacterium]